MNKHLFSYAIGFVVLLFILTRIDIPATVQIIASANVLFVIFAALLSFPLLAIEAFRWHYILDRLGIKSSFTHTFSMYAASLYIGFITPARLGEFVRVLYLRAHKIGSVFFSVFFDRIYDIFFLMLVGYFGMFFFVSDLKLQIFWFSIALAGMLVICAVAYFRQDLVRKILTIFFHRLVPEKFKVDLKSAFFDFHESFKKFINVRDLSVLFFVTLAAWILYYVQVYVLAKSLSINISFVQMATVMSIASLLSVLPISISGIGTRDAAFVFFFAVLGIPSEYAVALSAMVLFLLVFFAACCLPFWLKKPVEFNF